MPDTERALFAAGCFWGVEETFRKTPGVISTSVGYTGGDTKDPTYKDVCRGDTGHAETVEVKYDPTQVSYEKLLEIFWQSHDPTTVNRQGPDVGTQYRSVIFYTSPGQQHAAETMKSVLNNSGRLPRPIVTQIEPESQYFTAEDYHQQYFSKRGLSHA